MCNPRFINRILTTRECELCNTPERVAGRWAAKEALSKAIPGLKRWHAVEIINDAHGSPTAVFQNSDFCLLTIHLSITHEREWAAAMVIVEK